VIRGFSGRPRHDTVVFEKYFEPATSALSSHWAAFLDRNCFEYIYALRRNHTQVFFSPLYAYVLSLTGTS
jgi:hypothetical protein